MAISYKPFNYSDQLSFYDEMVNSGEYFGSAPLFLILPGNTQLCLIRTHPQKEVHGTLSFTATARLLVNIYLNPTVSNDGTMVIVSNFKTYSPKVAQTVVFTLPTITANGQFRTNILVPGSGGKGAIGTSTGELRKFILPPNTTFLLELNNISNVSPAVADHILMQFNFFEKPFPTDDLTFVANNP